MNEFMNIPRREVPDTRLSDSEPKPPEIEKVEGTGKTAKDIIEEQFDIATDRSQPLGKRIAAFISGETNLGRGAGAIFDVATIFLPNSITTGRQAIQTITKKQNKTMAVLNDKAWYQSKTIWAAFLILLTGILQAAGVDIASNPELTQTAYQIAYTLAGAFGLYGLRDAIGDKLEKEKA